MKVLVACEESQRVCMAFREKGHEAYSCDIIECSGGHPEWHIRWDALAIINGNCSFLTSDGELHRIDGEWDLIIAHPPCTYLTVTGNRWFNVERYGEAAIQRHRDREVAVRFFMAFANASCPRIAIENPVGVISSKWRKPDQIIHPYHFGHPVSKKTCLWLKGLPPLKHTEEVVPEILHSKGKSGGYSGPAWYVTDENGKILRWNDPRTARERSVTPLGVAAAMADQWG